MAVSIGRRVLALVGVMAGALALMLPASPASAQVGGPGAQATVVVGLTGTAACPTNVGAATSPVPGPVAAGTFVVSNAGAFCTSFSADTQGTYTVGGAGPLSFSSGCQTGGLQSGGSVTVPANTVVNFGQPGQFTTAGPTVIDTPNTVVRYPDGTVATLNVVETTATTVTRTAIVSGDTRIGRVICGAANVYPLAVDTAAAAGPASALPLPGASSSDGGGFAGAAVLIGAAVVLVVGAQVAVGRRMRGRGDATG